MKKRILSLTIIMLILFMMTGCGEIVNDDTTEETKLVETVKVFELVNNKNNVLISKREYDPTEDYQKSFEYLKSATFTYSMSLKTKNGEGELVATGNAIEKYQYTEDGLKFSIDKNISENGEIFHQQYYGGPTENGYEVSRDGKVCLSKDTYEAAIRSLNTILAGAYYPEIYATIGDVNNADNKSIISGETKEKYIVNYSGPLTQYASSTKSEYSVGLFSLSNIDLSNIDSEITIIVDKELGVVVEAKVKLSGSIEAFGETVNIDEAIANMTLKDIGKTVVNN